MDLPNIVACLDKIRAALAPIHAELALSSFVWIVHPGMRVVVDRDLTLFNYLNHVYWPYTYAEMRRLADFQNRVFEKYAQAHSVPFIDMAREGGLPVRARIPFHMKNFMKLSEPATLDNDFPAFRSPTPLHQGMTR
jgi:hypothetical protein